LSWVGVYLVGVDWTEAVRQEANVSGRDKPLSKPIQSVRGRRGLPPRELRHQPLGTVSSRPTTIPAPSGSRRRQSRRPGYPSWQVQNVISSPCCEM